MKRICILLLANALMVVMTQAAVVVFNDDFSGNGSLNGRNPLVGENWSVTAGTMDTAGGVMDTANTAGGVTKQGYAYFESNRALGAGETIAFNFVTVNTAGNWNDWAGVSLYEGGQERFFMGLPGSSVNWGIDNTGLGGPAQYTTLPGAAQTVSFTYEYDTGNWTYDVGAQSLSGTGVANLALDRVRIAVDSDADIAVTSMNAQIGDGSAVPEPGTFAFMGIAMILLTGTRRWRRVSNEC